jgi:hypothetical protein
MFVPFSAIEPGGHALMRPRGGLALQTNTDPKPLSLEPITYQEVTIRPSVALHETKHFLT